MAAGEGPEHNGAPNWITWSIGAAMDNDFYHVSQDFIRRLYDWADEDDAVAFFEEVMGSTPPWGDTPGVVGERLEDIDFEQIAEWMVAEQKENEWID